MEPRDATWKGEGLPAGVSQGMSAADRRTARLCLGAMAGLAASSWVGVAFSLYLVNEHPLLLIALSPLGRHLLLVAPTVDPVAFVAVAVTRRMLFYLASFRLGQSLGPGGIVWVETRAARFGRAVRWLERVFARASHAVVLCMTGPTVSTLAGISGMRSAVFAPLAALGLVARMVVVVGLAEWLRGPLVAVLELIDEYWLPGTVLIVAAIALHLGWRRAAAARAVS